MNVYSIYDRKASYYGTPFYLPTDTHAIREFTRIVHDANSNPNKFPEDYSIVSLGFFDDTTGTFTLNDEPRLVVDGLTIRKDVVQLEKDTISDYIRQLRDVFADDITKARKELEAFNNDKKVVDSKKKFNEQKFHFFNLFKNK